MIHDTPHPSAGQSVAVRLRGHRQDLEFRVDDWWDRLTGKSWMIANGNPAAMQFGMRSGSNGLPTDNEVVYGKIDGMGVLVHESEIQAGGSA